LQRKTEIDETQKLPALRIADFSQAGGNVVIIGVPGLAPTLDTNGRGTVRVRVSLQKLFMSTGPIPLTNIDAATM
jgi:hypothetical protein